METASGLDLNVVLLAGAGVVLACLLAIKASHRLGTPVLLLFVAVGMGLGESGLGLQFDDADLTLHVGTLLLAVILFEGGFTTKAEVIRPVAARSLVLATAGVLITIAITCALVLAFTDVDLRTALILGAVASSTDAAATFAVLRNLPVGRYERMTLEAESGLNDPPVIVLVSVIVSDAWNELSVISMVGMALYQLVVGAVVGVMVAWLGARLLRFSALPASGLYPVASVAIGVVAFSLAGYVAASGILACYVAALVIGNSRPPHEQTTQGFVAALAWLAQMGLFTMLGLLASPAQLPAALGQALLVGAALTFVARPIAVLACLTPFRVPLPTQAFIAWGGLRGAVPIVLAATAMASGVPGASSIFDVVVLLVIVFTLIQGPTLPMVARWTGVSQPTSFTELSFESAPLEDLDVVTMQKSVSDSSLMHGVTVQELRLPPGVTVPMLIRDGTVLVPHRSLTIRHGDHLVFTAPQALEDDIQRRLRQIDELGRIGGWSQID